MGDWKYVNGGWQYDSGAPDADPTVTSMLPVYAAPVITAGSPADETSTGPLDLIDCTCMPPENEHQHGGDRMIASPNHSARGNSKVRLVVIHTAEGARTTAALGNYFAKASVQASSHVGIDDTSIEQYVDYSRASWTVRAGNPISDNAELCGFAAWTRDQWLNEHRGMLNLTAQWVRQRCIARGIPIVKLTPAQVAAGQAGVIGHYDWTLGMRDGSHTDPGNGFPWDVIINTAANSATPPPAPGSGSAGVLPTLTYGMRGNASVLRLQEFLNAFNWVPELPLLPVTGNYLDQTKDVIRRAQAQMGVTGSDADGSVVGARTNAALWARGYRG